jgi:hypothetical protein
VTSREDDGTVSADAKPAPPVDALRTMLSQLSLQVLETEFAGVVGTTLSAMYGHGVSPRKASTMVERVRRDGQVRSTAALWVVGVGADGYRWSDEPRRAGARAPLHPRVPHGDRRGDAHASRLLTPYSGAKYTRFRT